MLRIFLLIPLFALPLTGHPQSVSEALRHNEQAILRAAQALDSLRQITDSLRLADIGHRLEQMGWPGSDGALVRHRAMALAYDEDHEMARWVAHIISKEVATGRTTRTNDFRPDPKVSTGSAIQEDYFLTFEDTHGETQYDGFGFDRGHLAPSADFRWNQDALSESYYYSNMTPQRPEFNRESWAEVEDFVRSYAIENGVDLYVVTGPVLRDELPKVRRSVNNVSIPDHHYKVVFDPVHKRTFGVLMPNDQCEGPVEFYAKTIREIEAITGLNFFPNLDQALADSVENTLDVTPWLPEEQRGDVRMLTNEELGKDQYNTLQAFNFADSRKKVTICGTAVSTFRSAKNNIFINLDKRFPNTVFTISIWSRDLHNFSYPPEEVLDKKRLCVKGEVTLREGIPQINASSEKQITFMDMP